MTSEQLSPPANLRKAVPSDIVPGAVIWHRYRYAGWVRVIVDEVIDATRQHKAYFDHEGIRCGLYNAWVSSEE